MPQPMTGVPGGSLLGSPAAYSLGLGSDLADQVAGETEEQRKKRLLEQQQRAMLGPSGSMAVSSLFGRGLGGSSF